MYRFIEILGETYESKIAYNKTQQAAIIGEYNFSEQIVKKHCGIN